MVIFRSILLSLFLALNFKEGFGNDCQASPGNNLGYIYNCISGRGCRRRNTFQYNLTCFEIDGSFTSPYSDHSDRVAIIETVTFRIDINILPVAAFTDLPLFSNLYMQNLSMEVIFPGAFNYQRNLTQIYLDGNRLGNVSYGIFNPLKKLRILNLARNRIDHITPNSFIGTRLEEIYLNNNNLSDLSSILFNSQTNLSTLDLSFNNLNEINDLIQNLSISNLNVSNNKLISVDIRSLLTIQNINLSNNQIEILKVDNKRNRIKVLDISKNKISTLNDILNEYLEVLVAGYNPLIRLDSNTFRDTIGLRELHLNNNNLSSILTSTFRNTGYLEYLNLSSNHLSHVFFGTFDGLSNLKTLDISNNIFKTLPQAFHSLHSLENFYFQYNEISDFNVIEFHQLKPNLFKVQLDNNKWLCDKLLYIVNYFIIHNVSIRKDDHFETSNIYGIQCQEDHPNVERPDNRDFKENSEISTNKPVENQQMFLANKTVASDENKDNNVLFCDLNMSKSNQNFTETVLFKKDFRNSSFVEYLESLNNKLIDKLEKIEKIQETLIELLTSKMVTSQD